MQSVAQLLMLVVVFRLRRLLVFLQLLLAVLAVLGVFLLVPRGVSVGTVEVHSTRMTFNATTLTYRIILEADVLIFNPNYLKVGTSVSVPAGVVIPTVHGAKQMAVLAWQVAASTRNHVTFTSGVAVHPVACCRRLSLAT
eukprot:GHRQ01028712.1.p1 GENE.GHRQ01028712.1~~GHRQ01028712.1.p1  ORF type:complete len:140 (+),score=45.89 GHRQ01028712.1:426-845(+)